ncbi:MAG: hypothetical protein JXQ83_08375 [Candidatus Glassbacteria bacterium]|nr:hypothetical protein [Candidatus Glassbacteria bacterium]
MLKQGCNLWFGLLPALLAVPLTAAGSPEARLIDCAACHGRISSEWRVSSHAAAYTSPLFLHELEKSADSPRSACSCHAPDFFVNGGIGSAPGRRADSPESGVDCLACHLDAEMVAWSDGQEWMVPHRVCADKRYSQAVFCGSCHTWAKDAAADCLDCHMPGGKGPVTDHPGFDRPADATHRAHRMPGSSDPEFAAGAASLEVRQAGGQLKISLTNLVPVHAFPQIRHRRAQLAVVEQPGGRVLWQETVRLAADSTAGYAVELPGGGVPLAVELRLYPLAELLPDSSLLLAREAVENR